MRAFTRMFSALDQTTKTNEKVAAMVQFFEEAESDEKLWAVALLSGRRPKRTVNTTLLREWAAEKSGIPAWLFEESYHIVGDLAETIAVLLPPPSEQAQKTLADWIELLIALRKADEEEKRETIEAAWDSLDHRERFVFNKLITGGWRLGVSQKLMVRALSKFSGIEENVLAHRLMGGWEPGNTTFEELIFEEGEAEDASRPYPFYLAYALEDEPEALGEVSDWQAEWKWDGIRGQLIVREDQLFVWSRGEELVTDKYPEYAVLANKLPNGTVLDGEILAWRDGQPLPFNLLQKRIGRKKVGKKLLKDAPVCLMAYDLLEFEGQDIREWPTENRREALEKVVKEANTEVLQLSPLIAASHWSELRDARENARAQHTEGLMLKRLGTPYEVGRKRGKWWKWKVDPLTIDAVLIYAMRGHGRRANLYTDYTFAVWDGETLVPFTKAYSGLTDSELREVDAFVKRNTKERFGPVRSVQAELVMEIAFEGISRSSRHKSGVALRFPRIKRWRRDKKVGEANSLGDLLGFLE